MSRGRHANYAYVITDSSRSADVRAGSRPAPELHRAQRQAREHAGHPARNPPPAGKRAPVASPVSVLAGILARDGSQLTATDTLQRELSRADHLADPACTWLWRTLREAEAAGLDGIQPHPPRPWSEQVPDTGSAELNN